VNATINALIGQFPQLSAQLSAIRNQALAVIDGRLRQFGCSVPSAPLVGRARADSPQGAMALAHRVVDEQLARARRAATSAGAEGRARRPAADSRTPTGHSGGL
jgi:hypothetical protein